MAGASLFQGNIEVIQEDTVIGWLFSPLGTCRPLLFVDTVPATLLEEHIPRPDVAKALGVAEAMGFAFRLPRAGENSVLSLFCVSSHGVSFIGRKTLGIPVYESSFVSQVERAKEIASKDKAVAIVCWDGAHNPVGRAKVLYDIVAQHHPAVLFTYLHREFGGRLWPPLINDDMALVAIPWEERSPCHEYIQRSGIFFDTVWICKPRLPSFSLASLVARPSARIIVDIDDDEEAFIAVQTARTAYNTPGLNVSRELLSAVPARTVASVTLQQRYGGTLVRHARARRLFPRPEEHTVKKIGFIGTVRHHKHIVALAKAIRIIQYTAGIPLEFHVYGDIQPPEELERLQANGAIVKRYVPLREHIQDIAALDVVVTGFPAHDTSGQAITTMQVPAKIFDALAAGVPVATPDTPAIADIRNVAGVYPFTLQTFATQIIRALHHTKPVTLPADATLEGAYAAYEQAYALAKPVPELHALLPHPLSSPQSSETLVLLWKQHDAGLYGRRVDQIARSYVRQYPEKRVLILELLAKLPVQSHVPPDSNDVGDEYRDEYTDERGRKEDFLLRKCHGVESHGILYKTLVYGREDDLPSLLFRYFVQQALLPDTTTLVLFPILQELHVLEDLLRPYKKIVDVVDNQLSWAEDDGRKVFVLEQYYRLFAHARTVIFNCEPARRFFETRHFLDTTQSVLCIPNWYTLPPAPQKEFAPLPGRHIWYSGNMNDRIDWALLQSIAELPSVRLHLAGTAQRVPEQFDALLRKPNVLYHGVTTEQETLDLLSSMHVALVPHVLDDVSRYMNPMKLAMYQCVGIPVLCPKGLAKASKKVFVYENTDEALGYLTDEDLWQVKRQPSKRPSKAESQYISLLA